MASDPFDTSEVLDELALKLIQIAEGMKLLVDNSWKISTQSGEILSQLNNLMEIVEMESQELVELPEEKKKKNNSNSKVITWSSS